MQRCKGLWIPKTVQRSALCRSRRELSNEYLLAKFGFDTAENEPCKVCPLSACRSPRSLYIMMSVSHPRRTLFPAFCKHLRICRSCLFSRPTNVFVSPFRDIFPMKTAPRRSVFGRPLRRKQAPAERCRPSPQQCSMPCT